ncbi:ATP-dependent DNA helicase RecQ [Marinobacterium nitratireducens]|uniref:DNA helicase RecQ n=1 Tax=Marinobacterium nitratireducens TaxID=518897 RepID=A0A917ZMS7_9GAMM|nr:DNA helicase RecQ [Marinobacterium nitratireducens]GGO87474.1 ATP-dependent DNA helicase RecQ [Marinobacterium nitratireducens]
MMDDALRVLKEVFGYDRFRTPQDEVIRRLVEGQDVLVVMPTGGGKSLCYQLPALLRPGTAVVVSPLIALMQDQVSALSQWGIRAGCLNSALPFEELAATEQALRRGELDLLYIAPERLLQPRTLDLLGHCRLALFAIDEAHCVSQWGHDFRPEYLQLSRLADAFPGVPRIALTATADGRTQQEIVERLALRDAARFIQGFDRPNIRYRIGQKDRAREQLLRFLQQEHPQDAGVVYCLSRKRVEETAAWLSERGFNALPYHAGLPAELRAHHQHRFLTEEGLVMVATIAFGMGIDKPNVRFVAHLDLPKSIEAYYQETGRAGRDGLPADAWMVYGLQDVIFLRQMLESSQAPELQKQIERQKLEAMLGLCEITSCRRQTLLAYFGENDHSPCGNCDTCLEPVPIWDGTEVARKALSAVYRSGQRFGVNHVIDILIGQASDKVRERGHDRISTFGIGKELDRNQWRSVFRQLVARGYLGVDAQGHGVLHLSERCRPLLRGEEVLELRHEERKAAGKQSRFSRGSAPQSKLDAADYALWNDLRSARKALADDQGVPPYVIFHDATLMEMVMHRPLSASQLRRLNGVGERKLALYGDRFLEVIEEHLRGGEAQSSQAEESLTLFRAGMDVAQVARQLKLSTNAIYGHLAQAIRQRQLNLAEVVELPDIELRHIEQVIRECEAESGGALKPVHEALGSAYDLGLLRCVKVAMEL